MLANTSDAVDQRAASILVYHLNQAIAKLTETGNIGDVSEIDLVCEGTPSAAVKDCHFIRFSLFAASEGNLWRQQTAAVNNPLACR